MRFAGAGHGDCVLFVLEAVVRFVADGGAGGLLFQVGGEAAALDHEVLDNAVKHRAVIKTGFDVLHKVGRADGRFAGIKAHHDVAEAGFKLHSRIRVSSLGLPCQSKHGTEAKSQRNSTKKNTN